MKRNYKNNIPSPNMIVTAAVLVVLLLISGACAYFMGIWGWFAPIGVILTIEAIIRIYQYAKEWHIRRKNRKEATATPIDTANGFTPTETPVKEPKLITNIADLPLKSFIQCCVYENLTVLGEGTPEQVTEAWGVLLKQYHNARGDEKLRKRMELLLKIKALEKRAAIITLLTEYMERSYSLHAANVLKTLYPQYQFTEETILADLKKVRTGEVKTGLNYEKLVKQYESMAGEGSKVIPDKEQQECAYMDILADINQIEHTTYGVETINTLLFARLERRRDKHIQNLKDQVSNGRR
jgi:hypothetical protein